MNRINDQTTAGMASEMALFPEMNPGPVIRTDTSGRILLVNAAARQLFGGRELVGESWPDTGFVDARVWQRTVAGEDRLSEEADVVDRTFVFTYRRPTGVDSIFIYGNDITERKRAEGLLEQRTREIAEIARFPEMNPGPVLRADGDAVVVLANEAARSLFGADSLIGRSWKDLCPVASDPVWTDIMATEDVVRIEAVVGERSFIFAHRRTPAADLVFIFGNDVTQLRNAEEALRQAEKMATLGTLAAGVAHELNNPAAAAARGAGQLREAFAGTVDVVVELASAAVSPERALALRDVLTLDGANRPGPPVQDPLLRSDAEAEIEEWLERRGFEDPWTAAGPLLNMGYGRAGLDALAAEWGPQTECAIRWIARAQPLLSLSAEIEESARRISEIVSSLKTYSFLGQAPGRETDVVEGIESTLVMLRAKLKDGIQVRKEIEPDLPRITAFGSELNQVWTNIIDNAIDAMGGRGTLTLRARTEGDHVAVEIEDDGPGVPDAVRSRIFDPFFTTKEPGRGTGLGLSTSINIVQKKHGGTIAVTSRPGSTCFTVRLPLRPTAGARP